MVTVVRSKDPPEIFKKRLEDAVQRFYLASRKEQIKKAPPADQSKSANKVDM